MTRAIDLNADLGERIGPDAAASDDAMLSIVSSANIACGGHAGDAETMRRTLVLAAERGVAIGAHPGYEDREGFGRREIPMRTEEIGGMVAAQVGALQSIAALANLAARDADVAAAIVDAVQGFDERLTVLAISGTEIERVARASGAPVASEIFADRGYRPDGQLVPRGEQGALLFDTEEAADRLLGFLETGRMPVVGGDPIELAADSVCVHGDTPSAVAMATRMREVLTAAGAGPVPFVAATS